MSDYWLVLPTLKLLKISSFNPPKTFETPYFTPLKEKLGRPCRGQHIITNMVEVRPTMCEGIAPYSNFELSTTGISKEGGGSDTFWNQN